MGGTCHCIKHPQMIGLFLGLPWFATWMCLFATYACSHEIRLVVESHYNFGELFGIYYIWVYIYIYVYVRCIWKYRNLEPLAYTRIEGKIWKFKGAPKNNVFFEKGLNRHIYIYIYISLVLQKSGAEIEHKTNVWWESIALRASTGVLGAKWNPIGNWATHKMWGNGWK